MTRRPSEAASTRSPDVLRLAGGTALSAFRRERLLVAARALVPALRDIDARYWHFAALTAELTPAESATLDRLLQYGPQASATEASPGGELLLVVPRLGTISPWSSKATDILHRCGLTKVKRVERGVAWYLTQDGGPLT